MGSEVTRRGLLAAGLVGIAGCSSLGGPPGLRLGGVVLFNRRGEDLTVELRIDREGTTVHEAVYEFDAGPPDDGTAFVPDWDAGPATYEFAVRVDGDPPERHVYDGEDVRGDCTVAYVGLREGTVHWASHPGDGALGCPARATAGG
jgi:hypothetical protein